MKKISHAVLAFVFAGACTDANKSIQKADGDAGTGGAGAGGQVADLGPGPRPDQGPNPGGESGNGGNGSGGNGSGGTGSGGNGSGGSGTGGNDKPDPDAGPRPGGNGGGGNGSGGTGSGGNGAGGHAAGGDPGTAGATGDGGMNGGGGANGGGANGGGGVNGGGGIAAGGGVGQGGSVGQGGDPGAGGVEPPPPPPPPACANPPCEWPVVGDWGPAARMTYFNVPQDAADARRVGCDLLGIHNGTALANARGLPIVGEGDLSMFFAPDANGVIPAIVLARLAGADAGELFGATGPIDFQFFRGVPAAAGAFRIDPSSFAPGTQNPTVHFANTDVAADGRLDVPSADFSMMIPVFGQVSLGVSLQDAIIRGWVSLAADGVGFDLPLGTIEGYLTRDAVIRDWIQPLQTICNGGAPLAVCAAVGNVIGPPGTCNANMCLGADLVAATLGSWEVHVDAAGPRVCNGRVPGDCNAVGVCFETRMEGVDILGVAP